MSNQKHTIKLTVEGKAHMEKMAKEVERSLGSIQRIVSGTQAQLLGLVGVGGLGALVIVSAKSGDALAKTADKIGVSTQSLARLHYVTEQYTNAGVGAMDEALTKATKRLGEFNATGGGAASKWLEKLGLDTKALAAMKPMSFSVLMQNLSGG